MKRSEFTEIVNSVLNEERRNNGEFLKELAKSDDPGYEKLLTMISQSYLVSAETSAYVTAKIIEKLGLVHFEDE